MSENKKPWFLSQEKKNRSDFWKSRKSGYSTSNYWLKDSIFEKKQSLFEATPSLEKESKHDHYQLAQYQRAISNFVRILTGRSDISVKYNTGGSDNYTDGKTITLSPNIKEKEFDTAVGLALHEASHIVHTDFKAWSDYLEGIQLKDQNEYNVRKMLANLVEDLYIDAMTYKSAPGYRGYYSSLYQKFFGDKKIVEGLWSQDFAEPTWNNYLFHLINIRNPERNLQALPGLVDMFTQLNLPNITRLSKFSDRIQLSMYLYDTVAKYVDANDEYTKQMQGQGGSATGDSESGSSMSTEELNEMLEQMADNDSEEGDGGNSNTFIASNGVSGTELQGTNKLDLDKLSDKAKTQLEKLFNQQREFVEGKTYKAKMSSKEQSKVDAFASVDMEKQVVGSGFTPTKSGVPLYIIRNITNSFMDSVGDLYGIRSYKSSYMEKNIEEGITRGKLLAKKLQIRNEERVLKTSRLDNGKIDRRLLHEIGFDNFDVFQKININAHKPSYVHISIDQSGSMGGNLFDSAMKFAAMFATASKYIKNIHLVISLRSSTREPGKGWSGRIGEETPYLMYIFDSKKHSIPYIRNTFSRIHANNLTPEGLCFDGIMKEVLRESRNTEAYFINICDGEPYLQYSSTNGQFSYQGEPARQHSRKQMQRMEQNGIKFVTYFIGSQHSFEKVRMCYGNNAVQLNTAGEIGTITKTLNKKLLEV